MNAGLSGGWLVLQQQEVLLYPYQTLAPYDAAADGWYSRV
jgi:hypothetical protein